MGAEGTLPRFDFNDRRVFYLVVLAGVGMSIIALINLRQSKTGRAFFAIRGSELAAASLGIDVTRYKLLAFAISGFVAGMAGNIMIAGQGTIVPSQFNFRISLLYLAIAVVGGLQSLGGAVASGMLFALLGELFYRVPALGGWLEVVSAGLLAVVLLFYPGGLAAVPGSVMAALTRLRVLLGSSSSTVSRIVKRVRTGAVWRALRRIGTVAMVVVRPIFSAARFVLKGIRIGIRTVRAIPEIPLRLLRRSKQAQPKPKAKVAVDVPDVLSALDFRSNGKSSSDVTASSSVSVSGDEQSDDHQQNGKDHFDVSDIPSFSLSTERDDRELVLEARGITVRFGGLTAVDDASLLIRQGEIVGLIGPNGAGKTTLFNAVAGFNSPQSGEIRLGTMEIGKMGVHKRAQLGIGRTFQLIQLFPQLTVFENLLVATHIRNDSGFVSHLVVTSKAARLEAMSLERVGR